MVNDFTAKEIARAVEYLTEGDCAHAKVLIQQVRKAYEDVYGPRSWNEEEPERWDESG